MGKDEVLEAGASGATTSSISWKTLCLSAWLEHGLDERSQPADRPRTRSP